MKKTNLLIALIASFSYFVFFNSITVSAGAVHDELNDVRKNGNQLPDKIMDEFKVSEVKKDGTLRQFQSRDTVMNDTKIQVKWGFHTKNKYEKNDVLTYTIPEGISLERDYSGDLQEAGDTSSEVKEPTRETNASFFMSKDDRTISIIFNKKTPAAEQDYNVTFETRLYFSDPDAAMLKELAWDTKDEHKIFYLNVPYRNKIQKSDVDSLILLDENGNETDKMPKKAKLTQKINAYQVVSSHSGTIGAGLSIHSPRVRYNQTLKTSIDKSNFKIETQSVTASGNSIGKRETLEQGVDYTINEDSNGNILVLFNKEFNKVLYVTFDVIFDYSSFVPGSNTEEILSTGVNVRSLWNSPYLDEEIRTFSNLYESKSLEKKFNVDYESQRKFLKFKNNREYRSSVGGKGFNKEHSEPNYNFEILVNLDEQKLVTGTKVLIELNKQPIDINDEQTFINEVKGAPIYSYDVEMEPTGKLTKDDYDNRKVSKDWKIEGDKSGHKMYLTYIGPETKKSVGLSVPIGRSSRYGGSTSWENGVASTRDADGKKWADSFEMDNISMNGNNAYYAALWSQLSILDFNKIHMKSTVNKIYMPLDKVEYSFRDKAEISNIQSATITNNNFENGEINTLEREKDYTIEIKNQMVSITFLTEVRGRIEVNFDMDYKLEKEDGYLSYTIYMRPKDGSPTRQLWTGDNTPPVWLSDQSIFLTKHNGNGYSGDIEDKIMFEGNKPINEGMYIINPRGSSYKLNTYKLGPATNMNVKLGEHLKFYRLKRAVTKDETFDSVLAKETSEEILPTDKDYPKVDAPAELGGNIATFTFKQEINHPIAVRFGAEKENYYDQSAGDIQEETKYEGNYHTDAVRGFINFTTKLKGNFVAEKSTKYREMVNIPFKVPQMEHAFIKEGTTFVINANLNNADIYNAKIILKDMDGNVIPSTDVDVIGNTQKQQIRITARKDLHKGIDMVIPVVYQTSGDKEFSAGNIYEKLTNQGDLSTEYRLPAKITGQNTVNIDVSDATGTGSITIRKLIIEVVDKSTQKPLAGAGFEISDGTDKMTTRLSGEDGLIDAGGLLLREYEIENTVVPEFYLKGANQKFTVTKDDKNKVRFELEPYSLVNVHFTYPDKTPLDEVNPKTIELKKAADEIVDLTKNDLVKAQLDQFKEKYPNYRYAGFDKGIGSGDETKYKVVKGAQDVYFYYQGVVSIDSTDEMIFEDGTANKLKQTLKYLDEIPFELTVKDHRQYKSTALEPSMLRGNFKINASLTKPFRLNDDPDMELTDAELFYNNGVKRLPLNGRGSEIVSMNQAQDDPSKKEFNFVLDKKDDDKSFEMDVTPNRVVKEQYYQGEITFELVQGP